MITYLYGCSMSCMMYVWLITKLLGTKYNVAVMFLMMYLYTSGVHVYAVQLYRPAHTYGPQYYYCQCLVHAYVD